MKSTTDIYNRVRELFDYHKDGYLTWKNSTSVRVSVKDIAGSFCETTGYFTVYFDRKNYQLHRIIFLYHHGYFPELDVDHIDRNRVNNRIENLREVSRQCNSRNSSVMSNNTSGITGVTFLKKHKKWWARICVDKKQINLGYFKNFNEAVIQRWKKEVELNWNGCNSTSSAYLYLKERGII